MGGLYLLDYLERQKKRIGRICKKAGICGAIFGKNWYHDSYWPAQEGMGYQVVIDLPEGTAAGFAPDTALVSVTVVR